MIELSSVYVLHVFPIYKIKSQFAQQLCFERRVFMRHHHDLDATVAKLRNIVEDCLEKHLTSSAIFFSDKLVTMSGGAIGDIFLHAKALFLGTHYRRAFATLHRGGLIPGNVSSEFDNGGFKMRSVDPRRLPYSKKCRLLAAQCLAAVKDWEGCLVVLGEGDDDKRYPYMEDSDGRGNLAANLMDSVTFSRSRSGGVRQKTIHYQDWQHNCQKGHDSREVDRKLQDGSVSTGASLCLMRGKVYSALENWKSAKHWCKEALKLDPFCFDAFEMLISKHLLTTDEESCFLSSLQIRPEDKWITSLYSTMCRYYKGNLIPTKGASHVTLSLQDNDQVTLGPAHITNVTADSKHAVNNQFSATSADAYCNIRTTQPELDALKHNGEVILARAEQHFSCGDYQKCYDTIQGLLSSEPMKLTALTCYLAVAAELRLKSKLYLCAHELVEEYPENAISWFAVACYYYCTRQFDSARRYFGKATMMESAFVPAWIGFGHAFAAQDESDQAMAAYRTATRIFPGCHLSLMCIGMEYHRTNNLKLAGQFLCRALDLCPSDFLVHNELGALAYYDGDHVAATSHLERAISLIPQPYVARWEAILVNLAHSYRKLNNFDEAINWYEQALRLAPKSASIYTALGFTYQLKGNFQSRMEKAIECYHKALSLKPNDTFAQEMLTLALIDQCAVTMPPYNFVAYDAQQPFPARSKRLAS